MRGDLLNEEIIRIKTMMGVINEQVDDLLGKTITDKLGDKSLRLWNSLDDVTKNSLINVASQKVINHVEILNKKGKKTTYNEEVKHIKKVTISTKPGESDTSPTSEYKTYGTPYTATYPDNTKQNPELQNFYLTDNDTTVTNERIESFNIMVSELKSLIPSTETIKEIHIRAGSSTSQVPTTYKKGKYKTIEEGQQNNITLSSDRCLEIENSLNEIIKSQFPNDSSKIIIDSRDVKPNNGPSYTEKERKYFFGEFKKLDPTKKEEYDNKYGPYKGSYGSVMIITEGKYHDEYPPEEQTTSFEEYYITLQWKSPKSKGKDKKYRSKSGGGISVGGLDFIPECPVW